MGAATRADWGRAATTSRVGGEARCPIPQLNTLLPHSLRRSSLTPTRNALTPDKFHEFCVHWAIFGVFIATQVS
jgi:hypothetical protein